MQILIACEGMLQCVEDARLAVQQVEGDSEDLRYKLMQTQLERAELADTFPGQQPDLELKLFRGFAR